jgi:ubiquitin carboxyl-terminal hydrolase 1
MTTDALLDIITRLNDPLNEGCRLWIPAELKSMRSWQQQDAQEYLSKVLDEIDRELLRAVKATHLGQGISSHETVYLKPGNLLPSRDQDEGERDTSGVSEVSGVSSHSVYMARNSTVTPLSLIPHRNPVEGLVAQRVGCLRCGFSDGLSLIPFNCITVPLGSDWLYDLRDCLDEYTSLEMIEGVECANCTLLKSKAQLEQLLNQLPTPEASPDSSETCTEDQPSRGRPSNQSSSLPDQLRNSAISRLEAVTVALEDEDFSENTLRNTCKIPPRNRVSTTKTRQAVIARAPKCLIIHINRSVFDELSGMQRKNYAKVQFQQTLGLGYWCLGSCVAEGDNEEAIEEWEMGPGKSMLRSNLSSAPDEMGPLYDLRAVVTHYGRHENGHYICYRKLTYPPVPGEGDSSHGEEVVTKPIERWWRISDDDVVLVSEEYVLEQGGAFMLFYERVEMGSVNSNRESLLLPTQEKSEEPDETARDPMTVSQSLKDNSRCDNSAAECSPLSKDEVENVSKLSETDSTSDGDTISLFSTDSPESATTNNTDDHINDVSIHSTAYSNGMLSRDLEAAKFLLVSEPEAGRTTEAEESLEEA